MTQPYSSTSIVTQSLENTFDMATEIESEQAVKEKRAPYSVKSPGRGGARKNSGRKKGATQKLSGISIMNDILQVTGKPFGQLIAEHYHQAALMGDWHAVRDYEKFILSKVIADKTAVDVTSNGQTMQVAFQFPALELPDWNK